LRTAHAILGDGDAAQDAVQETFLRLCREQESLLHSSGNSLGGWLATVLRNHCIDRLRRRRRHLAGDSTTQLAAPAEPLPVDAASVWRLVGGLPPLERAAVILRYRDGLSYAAIAAELGKTVTHIGVLLHQGLTRLRRSPQAAALAQELAP
jgi:RNA polymerase sigma-70 factor (ECF subfamily)